MWVVLVMRSGRDRESESSSINDTVRLVRGGGRYVGTGYRVFVQAADVGMADPGTERNRYGKGQGGDVGLEKYYWV